MQRIIHVCVFVAITAAVHRASAAEEIPPGATFTSPNGEFVAKALGGGLIPATDRIAIIETKTNREVASIGVNPPLYSLSWIKDSKALVIVSHIAGGSVASVIRLAPGDWKQLSADPREGDKYRVIRQAVKEHTVELTYKIAIVPKNDNPGRFYIYTFIFDPATAAHREEERQEIDTATYARLHFE